MPPIVPSTPSRARRPQRAARPLVAALVALAGLAGLATAPAMAGGATTVRLATGLGCAAHAEVRPGQVTFACADQNAYLGALHWTRWGATSARGTGTFYLNSCTPNCASSRVRARSQVSLVATHPVGGLFRSLQVTYRVSGTTERLTWAGPTAHAWSAHALWPASIK